MLFGYAVDLVNDAIDFIREGFPFFFDTIEETHQAFEAFDYLSLIHISLYVPNYLFSSISVENPGRMLNWRINFSIGILADDSSKIKPIISQIKDMLEKNEGIDQKQPLVVSFNQIGASSLNILVYCFTKTTVWKEWLQVQEDVYLSIIDIVQKNGSQMPYPTQTVILDQETKT